MVKQGLGVLALLVMAGCASDQGGSPTASNNSPSQMAAQQAPSSAELAAYAGSHQYPQNEQGRNDLHAAALVNGDAIKIYNFSTEPIRDVDVWVNRTYVRHVNAIGPGSSISLNTSNLYNSVGQQLSTKGDRVNLVQIEQDHSLQTLMGPVPE